MQQNSVHAQHKPLEIMAFQARGWYYCALRVEACRVGVNVRNKGRLGLDLGVIRLMSRVGVRVRPRSALALHYVNIF